MFKNYKDSENSTYHISFQDWAVPGDSSKIGMVWHIPSTEEVNFASQILHRILGKELEAVQSISADKPMKRYEKGPFFFF